MTVVGCGIGEIITSKRLWIGGWIIALFLCVDNFAFSIIFQNTGLNGLDTPIQLFQFLICGKINIERTTHFFVAPPCMVPFLLDEPSNLSLHHMSPIQVFSTR